VAQTAFPSAGRRPLGHVSEQTHVCRDARHTREGRTKKPERFVPGTLASIHKKNTQHSETCVHATSSATCTNGKASKVTRHGRPDISWASQCHRTGRLCILCVCVCVCAVTAHVQKPFHVRLVYKHTHTHSSLENPAKCLVVFVKFVEFDTSDKNKTMVWKHTLKCPRHPNRALHSSSWKRSRGRPKDPKQLKESYTKKVKTQTFEYIFSKVGRTLSRERGAVQRWCSQSRDDRLKAARPPTLRLLWLPSLNTTHNHTSTRQAPTHSAATRDARTGSASCVTALRGSVHAARWRFTVRWRRREERLKHTDSKEAPQVRAKASERCCPTRVKTKREISPSTKRY